MPSDGTSSSRTKGCGTRPSDVAEFGDEGNRPDGWGGCGTRGVKIVRFLPKQPISALSRADFLDLAGPASLHSRGACGRYRPAWSTARGGTILHQHMLP